jgi:hypothetical protein
LQRLAHGVGCRVGRQRRTGARAAADGLHQRRFPHLRVAARRETVEVDRVSTDDQLRHEITRITQRQRQADAAVLELQHMQAGQRQRPVPRELPSQRLQFRRRRGNEVVSRQRMPFDRHEVQARRAIIVLTPDMPRRQEVRAQPKSGFEHDELVAPAPAPGQSTTVQEHMARLAQRAVAAGIHVAVALTARKAVGVASESCGLYRHAAHFQQVRRETTAQSPRAPRRLPIASNAREGKTLISCESAA